MDITTKIQTPVVFFGSGPVAAKSLGLLAENFIIEAVITKPVPKHHKGNFPVIEVATKLNIPILTVSNKMELDLLFTEQPVSSRLAVLIDFGIIVSQMVIDYFPLGIVNSHFSILPEWRGADPITFSLLSGQKITGVSLMQLTAGLDMGSIIAYGRLPIVSNETNSTLTDKLITLSNELLLKHMPEYIENPHADAQSETSKLDDVPSFPTYSRKISKSDGSVDWSKPASTTEREIRAFEQWPKSSTKLGSVDVILIAVSVTDQPVESLEPGTTRITKDTMLVACLDTFLELKTVKPIGKKEMSTKEFLAGYSSRLQINL
ncbi:methionyl-tRNA formyltransferase [Candidatus Saccharibacteria bacterium]|nr:methionyl-tRNA formyltransferase [Candidatus Saccharibacteria bacterium]